MLFMMACDYSIPLLSKYSFKYSNKEKRNIASGKTPTTASMTSRDHLDNILLSMESYASMNATEFANTREEMQSKERNQNIFQKIAKAIDNFIQTVTYNPNNTK